MLIPILFDNALRFSWETGGGAGLKKLKPRIGGPVYAVYEHNIMPTGGPRRGPNLHTECILFQLLRLLSIPVQAKEFQKTKIGAVHLCVMYVTSRPRHWTWPLQTTLFGSVSAEPWDGISTPQCESNDRTNTPAGLGANLRKYDGVTGIYPNVSVDPLVRQGNT